MTENHKNRAESEVLRQNNKFVTRQKLQTGFHSTRVKTVILLLLRKYHINSKSQMCRMTKIFANSQERYTFLGKTVLHCGKTTFRCLLRWEWQKCLLCHHPPQLIWRH